MQWILECLLILITTDTFLLGMIMDGSLTLTSRVSPVEPAPGSYTFKQDDDEDQYIMLKDSIIKYWRSEESEGMRSAVAELLSNFSKTRKPTGSQFFRSSYTRLVMNFTREIRYLSWDNFSEEWSAFWWAPQDRCSVLNACGLSLLAHAWKLWKEEKVLELMEQTLSETCNTNEFLRCVNIELLCVHEDPNDRPTMAVAVVMLSSDTVTLPVPKQPAFVVRRDLSSTASSSSKPEASLNSESLATIGEGR